MLHPWRLLAIFLLLGLGISGLGYWAYRGEADYLRQKEFAELKAVADFKANQISD